MGIYGKAPAPIPRPICDYFEDHTPCPESFLSWHSWAEVMAKTHRQRKCPGCGLYEIWEPKVAHAEDMDNG